MEQRTIGRTLGRSRLEDVRMLRVARFVGEHTLKAEELLPEFQRIAVWDGLASARLQVRLGLEHVLLADAVEVAFQTFEIRRIVEQRADDFSKRSARATGSESQWRNSMKFFKRTSLKCVEITWLISYALSPRSGYTSFAFS